MFQREPPETFKLFEQLGGASSCGICRAPYAAAAGIHRNPSQGTIGIQNSSFAERVSGLLGRAVVMNIIFTPLAEVQEEALVMLVFIERGRP